MQVHTPAHARKHHDTNPDKPRAVTRLLALVLGALAVGRVCLPARAADPPWIARGIHAMVAADSPHASAAGREILQAGGNAIDAAVAVSFALAVTRPYSTGLGGGGFLIARFADGRVYVQDFRETAPAAAAADMFDRYAGEPGGPPLSIYGHRAVAVPGLVAGRCDALARFGTLPLSRVIAPAVRLARDGYPVDAHFVETTTDVFETYKRYPVLKKSCAYVFETFLRNGNLRKAGDTLVQPALARLLEGIAEGGPEFFYNGPPAAALAADMRRHAGLITESDLAAYRVREREPLRRAYRGYEIIGMPPPSSGGIALAQSLSVLERLRIADLAKRDRNLAVHFQIEAMKHAFADRARWIGDPDFVQVPTNRLISSAVADRIAKRVSASGVSAIDAYGSSNPPDDAGTSHFCIVDRFGNAVVSTETINTEFGSLAAVAEWGLVLNNEMDDFTSQPGEPNAFGLVQSLRNAIAPNKRPLSSMTPTILLKDGQPVLLLGGSGGPRIISSVLNVLLGVTDLEESLEAAMIRLRPHHQWRPDEVFFDAEPPGTLVEALAKRGHRVAKRRRTGVVQAILRADEAWVGASDPKKGGRPAGY